MTNYAEPQFPAIFTDNFTQLRQFDRDLIQVLGLWTQNLKAILDRGGSFADNMDVRLVSVTSHATPGTEFPVTHTLGKIPFHYIICGKTKVGTVYDGATANTTTTLYLRSDAPSGVFRLMIF